MPPPARVSPSLPFFFSAFPILNLGFLNEFLVYTPYSPPPHVLPQKILTNITIFPTRILSTSKDTLITVVYFFLSPPHDTFQPTFPSTHIPLHTTASLHTTRLSPPIVHFHSTSVSIPSLSTTRLSPSASLSTCVSLYAGSLSIEHLYPVLCSRYKLVLIHSTFSAEFGVVVLLRRDYLSETPARGDR